MTGKSPNRHCCDGEPPLENNTQLTADYVVRSHLNRGDVLDVYSVYSRQRATLCTAKLLRPSRAHDEQELHQLLTEGGLLTTFSHPHLVRGYEVIHGPIGPAVIMETLSGATLSRLVLDNGHISDPDVAVLADQLTALLHYLHGQGVLHLDLKPSNIIATGGIARVIDLNLAHPIGTRAVTAGTFEYKAPEQITGAELTPATDVWGFGGVLYRAITGRRPFTRINQERSPSEPPDWDPLDATHSPLASLVRACFSLTPAERPTVEEARRELGEQMPCSQGR